MSSKLIFADDSPGGGNIVVTLTEDGDVDIIHSQGRIKFTLAEIRQVAAWANEEEWIS